MMKTRAKPNSLRSWTTASIKWATSRPRVLTSADSERPAAVVHQPSGRHTAGPAARPAATARKPPYPAPSAKTPDIIPRSITHTPTKLVDAASAASASLCGSENSYSPGGGSDEGRAGAGDGVGGDARVGLVDVRGGSLIRPTSLYRRARWRLAARGVRSFPRAP